MSFECTRRMTRGCTLVLDLTVCDPMTVTDADGTTRQVPNPDAPRDITDALFVFTAKRDPDDDDDEALFQSRSFVVDPDQSTNKGKATLKIAANLTADVTIFPAGIGPVYHDIKIREADGDIFLLEKGPLLIEADASRSVA